MFTCPPPLLFLLLPEIESVEGNVRGSVDESDELETTPSHPLTYTQKYAQVVLLL